MELYDNKSMARSSIDAGPVMKVIGERPGVGCGGEAQDSQGRGRLSSVSERGPRRARRRRDPDIRRSSATLESRQHQQGTFPRQSSTEGARCEQEERASVGLSLCDGTRQFDLEPAPFPWVVVVMTQLSVR